MYLFVNIHEHLPNGSWCNFYRHYTCSFFALLQGGFLQPDEHDRDKTADIIRITLPLVVYSEPWEIITSWLCVLALCHTRHTNNRIGNQVIYNSIYVKFVARGPFLKSPTTLRCHDCPFVLRTERFQGNNHHKHFAFRYLANMIRDHLIKTWFPYDLQRSVIGLRLGRNGWESWIYNPGQNTSGHLSNFGRKVENLLYMLPSLYEQRLFFFRCLFCAPFPPDNVETCQGSMNGSCFWRPWKINIVMGEGGKARIVPTVLTRIVVLLSRPLRPCRRPIADHMETRLKTCGWLFRKWLFGPEKSSGRSLNRPHVSSWWTYIVMRDWEGLICIVLTSLILLFWLSAEFSSEIS